MSHLLRIVWTIARRDYTAIVFSRLFLLFLAVPVIATAAGAGFAAIGSGERVAPARPLLVIADDREAAALRAARARLIEAFGADALPPIERAGRDDARGLLVRHDAVAVLSGPLAAPRLLVAPDARHGFAQAVGRLAAEAAHPTVAGLRVSRLAASPASDAAARGGDDARRRLAEGGQYAIFLFTIGLAGRLLANFIEERGNKAIELLVAAVPVEAIFYGKLLGMLLFSFTCIAAWLGGGAVAVAVVAPAMLGSLAEPAVGWPAFVLLGTIHFALGYLLIGTVMLGLGAQTRTPADVQTLALPLTLAQLGLFAIARATLDDPAGPVALVASALPWSTSLTAIAHAASDPKWWPQVAAIGWQLLWLAVSVRIASTRFRRAVLASGPVRGRTA